MSILSKKVKKVFGFEEEDLDLYPETNIENEYLENYEDLYKAISDVKRIKEDRSISLNDKVNNIIKWYKEEYLEASGINDIAKYYAPFDLRDFIEKVAVWYELRYPACDIDCEINPKMKKNKYSNNAILGDNEYVESFFAGLDMDDFEWSKFYNTHAFVRNLDDKEKEFFFKARYPKVVYWNNGVPKGMVNPIKASVNLSKTGKVISSEHLNLICHEISDRKLVGMHIVDVINLLNSKGIKISPNNSFVKAVQNYEMENTMRKKVFDAIMYRIIERGGERVGPKRGFLFAKEFGMNIDIPMKYGMDSSDPCLNEFINEYLKAGGNRNLECLENYFTCKGDYTLIRKVNISEVLNKRTNYTEEEKELAQRLVDMLASRIDYDVIRKEDARKNRLQKQLRKSKFNR